MTLQIGKLLLKLRKQQKMTQQELCNGIVSKTVMSRIENGLVEPEVVTLIALMKRLGKKLIPFEIAVSHQEYEILKQENYESPLQVTVVVEKNFERYYGYIVSQEYEVYELVELYHQKRAATPEEATRILKKIKLHLDDTIPVNKQFLESSELMEKRRKNIITRGEELAALEQCLRYTMPEYDGRIYRMPFRQEVVILEEIIKCLKRLKRTEAALQLAQQVEERKSRKIRMV